MYINIKSRHMYINIDIYYDVPPVNRSGKQNPPMSFITSSIRPCKRLSSSAPNNPKNTILNCKLNGSEMRPLLNKDSYTADATVDTGVGWFIR